MDESSGADQRTWSGQPLTAAAAVACCGGGLFLASHHPLWPAALVVVFTVWVLASARWQGLWLFALPAAMPVLNFSPWTGWLIFDEFDLLVLGSLAGGLARQALVATDRRLGRINPPSAASAAWNVVPLTTFCLALAGLARGIADGGHSFGWFAGYAEASNTLRVSKSLIFVSALCPLLGIELTRSPLIAIARLARGMQIGLTLVGLAVLWERTAYPSLLDFSERYRTVGTFWEMHVGGAAIDVYLALAAPFAAWAVVSAKSRRGWAAAAALALLTGHACLTTFSRGAYVGVVAPLLLLGAASWYWADAAQRARTRQAVWYLAFAFSATALLIGAFAAVGNIGIALAFLAMLAPIVMTQVRHSMQWRRAAALGLMLALATEAVAVVGGGTFMRSRLDASERDWGARLAHWRRGVGLLHTPADWLLGIGAGRLPTHYAREVPRGEFSGALTLETSPSGSHAAELAGPATVGEFAGLFSLTQRITLQRGGAYRVGLRVRAASPTIVTLDLCEQHLLYSRQCQGALVRVMPDEGEWQSMVVSLEGPGLDPGHWYAPRLGLFSVSIRDTGTAAEFAAITLIAPDGTQLLANSDFSASLAQWFPEAESHFLPWHIDNFYLELLIEHGAVGLAAFLLLMALASRNLFSLWRSDLRIAPFLAASLLGALLVGCVSSVLDVPRISFLFLLIIMLSLQIGDRSGTTR